MKNLINEPCSVSWFQKELDALCRGRNAQLRIVWAPRLRVTAMVKENEKLISRTYAKYPLVSNEYIPFLKGHFYKRSIMGEMVTVGYEKVGGIISGNVLPTDLIEPDYEYINHSVHMFVIERKRPDDYARQVHSKKRQLSLDELGVDLFGDFPAEGVWDWWGDISEHRDGCCEAAKAAELKCRGLYREPDRRDLEGVRKALSLRDGRRNLVDKTLQVEQAAKDIGEGQERYRKQQRELRLQEAREMDRLAIAAVEKNSIYLDKTKARIE